MTVDDAEKLAEEQASAFGSHNPDPKRMRAAREHSNDGSPSVRLVASTRPEVGVELLFGGRAVPLELPALTLIDGGKVDKPHESRNNNILKTVTYDFLDASLSEAKKRRLRDAFMREGCSHDIAIGLSAYVTIQDTLARCRSEWAKIPTYKTAKADGSSKDPLDHFDKFWKPYAEAGFLFQHFLKLYDPRLISDIHGFLRRHPEIDPTQYRISPFKEYNSMLAEHLDTPFGQEVLRVMRTIDQRRARGDDASVGPS